MDINLHLYFHADSAVTSGLAAILAATTRLEKQMSQITDSLDALNAKVTELETVEGSAIALLQGLKAALDAALSLGDASAVVAAVTEVTNKLGADAQALADAVTANTPTP